MAYLVINNKFKPYSYEERLAPYQQYIEDFRAQEIALQDLTTKAATIKNLLGDSTQAAMQYQAYEEELIKQADLLSREGLNPVNRQGVLNMKKRYNSDITPIQTAIELNRGLSKQRQEAILRDNSLISTEVPTIDDLLSNPNATYNAISGNQLTEKASAISSTLSKIIKDSPQVGKLLDGYLLYSQQYGYSPNDVVNTILQDDKAPKELKEIVNSLKQEIGYDNWDNASKQRIDSYINSGIYNAIGQSKEDIITDRGYISPAEERRLQIEEERWQLQKDALEEEKNNPYRNIDVITTDDGRKIGILPHGKLLDLATGNPITDTNSSITDGTNSKYIYTLDSPLVIAKTNDKWRSGNIGDDVNKTLFGMTRSNVVNTWGNYNIDNIKPTSENIVTDFREIPLDAMLEIEKQVKEQRLDLSQHNIIKIKADGSRQKEYDYVLIKKLQTPNSTAATQAPPVNSGDNEGL